MRPGLTPLLSAVGRHTSTFAFRPSLTKNQQGACTGPQKFLIASKRKTSIGERWVTVPRPRWSRRVWLWKPHTAPRYSLAQNIFRMQKGYRKIFIPRRIIVDDILALGVPPHNTFSSQICASSCALKFQSKFARFFKQKTTAKAKRSPRETQINFAQAKFQHSKTQGKKTWLQNTTKT